MNYKISLIFKISLYPLIFSLPFLQAITITDYIQYNDAENYRLGYNYIYSQGFSIEGNPYFGKGYEFILDFVYYIVTVGTGSISLREMLIINGALFSIFYVILIEVLVRYLVQKSYLNRNLRHTTCLLLYSLVPLGISNQLARQSILLFIPLLFFIFSSMRILKLVIPPVISLASHTGSILVSLPFYAFYSGKQENKDNFFRIIILLTLIILVCTFAGQFLFDLTNNPVLRIKSDRFSRLSSNVIFVLIGFCMLVSHKCRSWAMLGIFLLSLSLAYFSQPIIYRIFYGLEFLLIPLLFMYELSRYRSDQFTHTITLLFALSLIAFKTLVVFMAAV
jgi:hypothetical protein